MNARTGSADDRGGRDPSPRGAPPDGGTGTGDVAARLDAVERRLRAVEDLAEHARALAESANHVASVVDPRTVHLRSEVERLQRSVDELQTFAADLQRMASTIWDETAVVRRIARIEDLLLTGDAAGTEQGSC